MRYTQLVVAALLALVALVAASPFERLFSSMPASVAAAIAPMTAVAAPVKAGYTNMTAAELLAEYTKAPTKLFIIDVREAVSEFAESHIVNARNIPLGNITSAFYDIPNDVPLYVHCRSGMRSAKAAGLLADFGFKQVININDGFLAWTGPVTKEEAPFYAGIEAEDVLPVFRQYRIIDIRPAAEYAASHIAGAVSAPALAPAHLRFNTPIMFVGNNCDEGSKAAEVAVTAGVVGTRFLFGGMRTWKGPVEPAAAPAIVCNGPGCGLRRDAAAPATPALNNKRCSGPGCGL